MFGRQIFKGLLGFLFRDEATPVAAPITAPPVVAPKTIDVPLIRLGGAVLPFIYARGGLQDNKAHIGDAWDALSQTLQDSRSALWPATSTNPYTMMRNNTAEIARVIKATSSDAQTVSISKNTYEQILADASVLGQAANEMGNEPLDKSQVPVKIAFLTATPLTAEFPALSRLGKTYELLKQTETAIKTHLGSALEPGLHGEVGNDDTTSDAQPHAKV